MSDPAPEGRPYETRDAPLGRTLLFLVGGLVAALLLVLPIGPLLRALGWHGRPAQWERPPEPRLEARASEGLAELREWERRELETYGFLDRDAGVVRLPIERAMQLLAEEAR